MGLQRQGSGRIPDIFADVDANMHVVDAKDGGLATRLEIAVLVKNSVVGQVVLMVDTGQPALGDDGGSIVDIMVTIYKTDDGGQTWQVAALLNQFIQLTQIIGNKARL